MFDEEDNEENDGLFDDRFNTELKRFEKMLNDQAMLLWVYSIAFKIFGEERYKQVAKKIIFCFCARFRF